VLARMTKPGMPSAGGPKRTSIGIPIQPPPPPAPTGPKGSTAPRLAAQRPPAGAKTMMMPGAERAGTADVSTVVVDPMATDDDIGFPSIATEKGFFDLEDDLPPGATARGFVPSPNITERTMAAAPELELELGPVTATPASPTIIVARPQQAPQPVAAPRAAAPVVLDVTPRGLGIGTVAGFCEELIRRNSRVPTKMRKLFTTSRDGQEAVRIIVVQGESRRMDNNTVIADLRLDNLPRRPRGETSIEVTFLLDANGILQIHARDPQTGREQRASLDIVGSIAQEDVSSAREKLQALRR